MKVPAVSLPLLASLALLAGCAELSPTTGPASSSIRKHQPMLLIFAAEEQDARMNAQRKELGPVIGELEARKVVVVDIVGVDPLRDAFVIPMSGFHVVLVDERDNVKLQVDDVATSEQIAKALAGM